MTITFVKKILANGEPCPKCRDVEERLARDGVASRIDSVLIADERDPDSPGLRIAAELGVTRAPFFIVENEDETIVYTVYFKFLREVLRTPADAVSEARELLAVHPDLDRI